MVSSRFVRIVALLALLLTAFAASAQPAPRGIPVNDNFASAATLVPGKAIKLKDPAAATEENLEPNPCGQTLHNSVWYKFTPAANGTLALSIGSTLLFDPIYTGNDAVLQVYIGAAINTLTPLACAFSGGGVLSDVSFNFLAGTTYYFQAATLYDFTYSANSFFSLTTRITRVELNPVNADFESPLSPGDWTLKKPTGDGLFCSNATYPSFDGICAFGFAGNAGEKATLKQTVIVPSNYVLRKGGLIRLTIFFSVFDAPVRSAKITATLTYKDGTPPSKITITLNGQPDSGSYLEATGVGSLASGKLSKITLQAASKSADGVLLIDRFRMTYNASPLTRETGGALPVPPPASDLN